MLKNHFYVYKSLLSILLIYKNDVFFIIVLFLNKIWNRKRRYQYKKRFFKNVLLNVKHDVADTLEIIYH